jgi:hypothetical protein
MDMSARDIRGIKVEAIRGERDGQTGYVSVWPIFDKQDLVNVGWDDGTITTAHPCSGPAGSTDQVLLDMGQYGVSPSRFVCRGPGLVSVVDGGRWECRR